MEKEFTNTEEQTTVNDRVQQIIDHYNLNKSSFSKAIGLSGSMTISNIVGKRQSKPGYEVLQKIAKRFPINLAWLILGEGPMLLGAEDELKRGKTKIDKIVELILECPEEFEQHPVFAKYLENERNKAIIANQNEFLLKLKKLDLDQLDNA